jgi:hypothetical protein
VIIVETRLEQLHVETLVIVSVVVLVTVIVWVSDRVCTEVEVTVTDCVDVSMTVFADGPP